MSATGARAGRQPGVRLESLRTALAPLGAEVFGVLYPARCALCGGRDLGDGAGCAEHRLGTRLEGPRCGRCAARLAPVLPDGDACRACRARSPRFARAACLLDYHDPAAREWVLALKHGSRRDLSIPLGRLLGARLRLEPEGALQRVLVPVPLHPARVLERGYDQARLLARQAALEAGVPLVRALARVRATPPQGSPAAGSRARNVRGAFAARRFALRARGRIVGAECWLVDDVLTSGATAGECARILRRLGAARVNVLALARA